MEFVTESKPVPILILLYLSGYLSYAAIVKQSYKMVLGFVRTDFLEIWILANKVKSSVRFKNIFIRIEA